MFTTIVVLPPHPSLHHMECYLKMGNGFRLLTPSRPHPWFPTHTHSGFGKLVKRRQHPVSTLDSALPWKLWGFPWAFRDPASWEPTKRLWKDSFFSVCTSVTPLSKCPQPPVLGTVIKILPSLVLFRILGAQMAYEVGISPNTISLQFQWHILRAV